MMNNSENDIKDIKKEIIRNYSRNDIKNEIVWNNDIKKR